MLHLVVVTFDLYLQTLAGRKEGLEVRKDGVQAGVRHHARHVVQHEEGGLGVFRAVQEVGGPRGCGLVSDGCDYVDYCRKYNE